MTSSKGLDWVKSASRGMDLLRFDCGRLRNGNGQIEILAVRQAGAGDTHDISMLIYQWSAVISTVEGATISYNFSADNFRFPPQAVKKTDSRIAAVSKTRFIAGASSRPKLRIPRQTRHLIPFHGNANGPACQWAASDCERVLSACTSSSSPASMAALFHGPQGGAAGGQQAAAAEVVELAGEQLHRPARTPRRSGRCRGDRRR